MMDREVARENLSLTKSILEKHNVSFTLGWGTCLGAVRDQDFISHDGDIDLDINHRDMEKVLSVASEFEEQEFDIGYSSLRRIELWRKGLHIDLFPAYPVEEEGKTLGWVSDNNFIAGDLLEHSTAIAFLGEEYRVPKNTVEYLAYLYGPSWQTPIAKNWLDIHNFGREQKPIDLEVRSKNLRDIKSVFDAQDIKFWLDKKTCRNAVMPESLSEPDVGITLLAYLRDRDRILSLIPEIQNKGFEIVQALPIPLHLDLEHPMWRFPITLKRQGEFIDIDFVTVPKSPERRKGVKWYCGKERFAWDFFGKPEAIQFLGNTYLVPRNPQRYLDYLYGFVWWQPRFEKLSHSEKIQVLADKIDREKTVELICKPPLFPENSESLILYGDRVEVRRIDKPLRSGKFVLVYASGELSIQQVAEVNSEGNVLLRSSEVYKGGNTWHPAAEVLAEVVKLRSRLGVTLPLNSIILQFLVGKILPKLLKIRQSAISLEVEK